jgi:surface-anchored protein
LLSKRSFSRAAGGALIALALSCDPAVAAPVVLDDGHVDYAARMVDGRLQSQIKDGTRGPGAVVWREPADVVFRVDPEARTTVPNDPRLTFLGAPGDPVWLLPQVQRTGILWAGWNTEELGAGDLNGPVTWALTAVEGPGAVALFQTRALQPPDVLFNSRDGLPDARGVPLGTHAHGNWAFSSAGTYRLTFAMTGTRPSGEALADTETVTVAVVGDGSTPQPGGTQPPPTGGTGGPDPDPPADPRLTLRDLAASARGRMLTLRLRLNATSRVRITVRKGSRTIARAKPRTVPARTRRVRVRLNRRLAPGRYKVRVRAIAGSSALTRTSPLRVRATAGTSALARARPVPARGARAAVSRPAPVVLSRGHVDYAVRMVGGRLQSRIKDSTRGSRNVRWREPSDVVFRLGSRARSRVPAGGRLDFLGDPGDPIWMIPQVEKRGVLWAGWNTEELGRRDISGRIAWRLTDVDGPGPMAIFSTGSFGQPDIIFNSSNGLPDRFEVPLGTHGHGNWAFRRRGRYRLRFEMSGRRPSGARVSDTATLTVDVGR